MRKRYIIFDFDGTLVNTNDIIIESWQATFRRFLGHEMDEETIIATFGETLMDSVAKLIPDAEYSEVCEYYRNYQETNWHGKVHVFEGVRELLEELIARGYKIGVATSRATHSFRKYMEEMGLTEHIDEVVAMEDVTHHKPHPESVEKVLEKFGATPDEAIMIGDSPYDIGCARGAGVDSVMVKWSHPVNEDKMAAEGFAPTHYITKPAELLELV